MAGTIRKRARETWEVRFELGRDPGTGRRRFRYRTVRGTKKDAERALTQALHRRDTGTDIAPARVTVAEYLQRWLRDYAAANVAPSTLRRYQQIVGRLLPLLGSLRLQHLRPTHIQEAYAALLQDGLAARTVLHHHRVLREALQHAVRWQLAASNPADAVSPPRPAEREMRALTPDEVHRLLAADGDPGLRAIIHVAVTTGLRLCELLGLRWSDLDLDGGTASISRAAQYLSGTGITFRQPKSARSRRNIALSAETVRTLREHRRRQLERRLATGPAYVDQDLVFSTADGSVRPPYQVQAAFRTLVQRVGLGPVRFHDLRHTAATLMLRAGVPIKIVSTRLGHATAALTLDTYSHVTPDMQREAAAAVDAVLESR